MPAFVKGGAAKTPFGKNEFLFSTKGVYRTSYTLSAAVWPAITIDGATGQKVAQPGTVLAKITSTAESGKVGPYNIDASITDGRQTAANIVGLLETFLPWQLMEHDAEVAVVYGGVAVQAWCFEYTGTLAAPVVIAASNTAATAMQRGGAAGKLVDITFR
jgi:hypothetical protein